MPDGESKTIKVDEDEVIEEPTLGTEDPGLLSSDEGPRTDTEPEDEIMDLIDTADIIHTPQERKIINDPEDIVNVNIKKGGNLQKFVGNPIGNDVLLEAIRNEDSTATVLHTILEEIAEEAAFIKAWRNENWDSGKDLSEATYKRIRMLRHLVDTLMDREKLKQEKVSGKIDFFGENFQNVLKYFLGVIEATFKKVNIPEQYEKIFFTELAKEYDDFEKKAEKVYYGKDKR